MENKGFKVLSLEEVKERNYFCFGDPTVPFILPCKICPRNKECYEIFWKWVEEEIKKGGEGDG